MWDLLNEVLFSLLMFCYKLNESQKKNTNCILSFLHENNSKNLNVVWFGVSATSAPPKWWAMVFVWGSTLFLCSHQSKNFFAIYVKPSLICWSNENRFENLYIEFSQESLNLELWSERKREGIELVGWFNACNTVYLWRHKWQTNKVEPQLPVVICIN